MQMLLKHIRNSPYLKVWLAVLLISLGILYVAVRLNQSGEFIIGALTAGATVFVAVGVRQLELGVRHLQLDTLNFVYQLLDKESFKEKLHKLIEDIRKNNEDGSQDVKNDHVKNDIAKISATFNRIGYFIYKGYLDIDHVAELFGFLILKSFLAFKPYLEKIRQSEEGSEGPWFFRRYYLLLVVALEKILYINPDFQPKLHSLYKQWKQPIPQRVKELPILVPKEWLSSEVRSWLKKNDFL
jgi:hypothetical protein